MAWDFDQRTIFFFLDDKKNQYFNSQTSFLAYPKSNLQDRPCGIVHNYICGGMIFSYVAFK